MGDEGSAPPSGAGRSNRRNRNRTAGSSKALPPETPKVQDTLYSTENMAGAAAAFAFNLDEPQFFHRYRLNELSDGYLFRTTRLTRPVIGDLLTLLRPILQHPTNRCDAVAADTQLIVALTFYASGGFQWASAMAGHTSQSTTCRIIRAVTDALCDIAPQFIRFPMTVAEQTHTKHQFYRINHFPNVLGAIDGTHINIKRPPGEHPEQYVNRHGRFSMNVMAVCDANLKFLNVYADYPGSNGDGYIWAASELGAAFRNGAIVDGWLLGDSAYPLQPWLMTPLQNPNTDAEHGYNRAHKKTRSTIERSFGLLKSRFRCLDDSGGDLCYSPLRVCKITKACCVLHNICCDARIEMVVDEGVALRVAAMANGPPRAIQRAGAGMAVQRRLIDNHQWLPPQNGDEGSAPPSGAGRSNRRNKSSGTAGSSRALPPETPKVQDTLVATGATCPSNVGPMPSTRKTRNKIPVVTSLSTRVQKMSAPEFTGLKDPYDKIMGSRDKCNLGTGLVLHMIMGNPVCLWDANYPENPGRFYSVLLRSNALGLLDRCALIEARKATKEEILRLHSESHFNQLEAFDACNENVILESFCAKFDAVYIHPSTFQAACLAAGSTIQLVDEICTKKITNGIAIVRPPGHHAMENEYNGYCFFNNVALAAKHALEKHHLQRVLIVDWDVHHGQGTQQMFYGDKRVLYFSIHRYENGSFWPYLSESNLDRIGDGAGKGFNINVPLNTTGLGNSEYMAIFHKLLLPVAYEFRPEVVLVSAGFDSALGDEKGEMEVTPNCYAHLLWSLKGLAQGNVAVVLEGGYCLKSLQEGVAMTLRSLLGDPCPMMEPLGEPHQVVKDTILRSIVHLMPYWKCLYNDYKMGIESSAKVLSSPIWPSPPLLMLQVNQPPYATRNCYPVPSEEQFKFYDNKIELLINATNFTTAAVRVCYAYEVEMANYVDDSPGLQVEHPDRILVTNKLLVEFGLVARCKRVKGTPAQPSDILLAHDQDYHSFLKNTSEMSVKDLEGLQKTFNSVILKNTSYASMMIAVGCLINVVDDVCSGLSQSGVAVIRPPGHHAEPNHPSGFCLVNNVAIAAKHAQKKFGLKRVLILDWDVHHGNGTQRIFYEDPSVLYISIHRYDGGRFFPSGPDGNSDKVGVGLGEGFNVNIPWSSGGMHDGDYLAAFTNIIMPIAYEYNPELVIISAGFDAAVNDPLGRCLVTPEAYGHFTHWLMSLANGRVIVALEGGYNVHSVSTCMASCMKALLNDPLTMLEHVKASYGALRSIYETSNIHCKYWACLRVKNAGANARQIINGTHLFALKQFGKEYDQLNPNEQIDCFRSLINPFHVLDSDATTVISQFLNLSLNNKVKEDSLP